MKKLLIAFGLLVRATVQTGSAQTAPAQPALLPIYYDVKEALVKGNASLASAKAQDFVKALATVDAKLLGDNREPLAKEAQAIAKSTDLKVQRETFSSFSNSMATLAKNTKLSAEPIYKQYCPMKKSYWLSSEKAIKNPYYGSAMLTCGSVVETL